MNEGDIHTRINGLVEEEKALREAGDLSRADRERLESLEVELDRYWDLLRQRRARREFGQDPATAELRDAETVEKYEQ